MTPLWPGPRQLPAPPKRTRVSLHSLPRCALRLTSPSYRSNCTLTIQHAKSMPVVDSYTPRSTGEDGMTLPMLPGPNLLQEAQQGMLVVVRGKPFCLLASQARAEAILV